MAEYFMGYICETEDSYDNAFFWYHKAAAKDYPSAILNLGYLYERGLGVEKNIEKANDCYQRSKDGLEDWKKSRGIV